IAGAAFAALAICEVPGVAQLGVLCGLGEVLTAVAILLVTPEIGAYLEKQAAPPPLRSAWLEPVRGLTSTKRRPAAAGGACVALVVLVALLGWPRPGPQLVAMRPRNLLPLATAEEIYGLFGGRPGQWVVMSVDRDPDRAAARADAVAEALEPLLD